MREGKERRDQPIRSLRNRSTAAGYYQQLAVSIPNSIPTAIYNLSSAFYILIQSNSTAEGVKEIPKPLEWAVSCKEEEYTRPLGNCTTAEQEIRVASANRLFCKSADRTGNLHLEGIEKKIIDHHYSDKGLRKQNQTEHDIDSQLIKQLGSYSSAPPLKIYPGQSKVSVTW